MNPILNVTSHILAALAGICFISGIAILSGEKHEHD